MAVPSAGTKHNATTAVSANDLLTFFSYFAAPREWHGNPTPGTRFQRADLNRRLLVHYFLGGGGGSTIFILGGGGLNSDVGTPTILGFVPVET
ncbi:MAG: hypothetical protein EXR02_03860 [Rhodospirillales bacterium]|nr:hypothetical protein [Rhodospirillales bacterium]